LSGSLHGFFLLLSSWLLLSCIFDLNRARNQNETTKPVRVPGLSPRRAHPRR
jgi:hypothetical protein